MKAKHVLLILLVAALIVGCCVSQPTAPPASHILRESIELVGFNPTSREQRRDLERILNKYNTPENAGIFKVWRYDANGAQPLVRGTLEDIGCELEGMIKYVSDRQPPGGKMTHTTGITDYAGRIGLTCSTSCGGHSATISNAMV